MAPFLDPAMALSRALAATADDIVLFPLRRDLSSKAPCFRPWTSQSSLCQAPQKKLEIALELYRLFFFSLLCRILGSDSRQYEIWSTIHLRFGKYCSNSLPPLSQEAVYPINGGASSELALSSDLGARRAYFLWSSTPTSTAGHQLASRLAPT
ncbi:hypothetical protein HDV63DRAFT_353983 [Trichoderma sp. SZMC 28014]